MEIETKLNDIAVSENSGHGDSNRVESDRERWRRNISLLGDDGYLKLRAAHVAVFGLGGVGSWCADALARAGIGALTLVDSDTVSLSNVNRQLCARSSTVGRAKSEVMSDWVRDINPELRVRAVTGRYCHENRESFLAGEPDFIVDAIDLVTDKLDLILGAMERGIRCVSAMGAGNKRDGSAFELADIYATRNCSLSRVMRRELRRRGVERHMVVYSPELPQRPDSGELPPPGRRSVPGSLVWVTAPAGMLLAQYVIDTLTYTFS